ncbi:MAG: hypothetical protein ABIH41_04265 [Nanoarchaeota archaeon]
MANRAGEVESLKRVVDEAIVATQEWASRQREYDHANKRYERMIELKRKILSFEKSTDLFGHVNEELIERVRQKIPELLEGELNIDRNVVAMKHIIRKIDIEIYVIHNNAQQQQDYQRYLQELTSLLEEDLDYERIMEKVNAELTRILKTLKATE